MKKLISLTLLMAMGGMLWAQSSWIGQDASNKNYISTGMPILLIAPDAVSAALGDAGVASTTAVPLLPASPTSPWETST